MINIEFVIGAVVLVVFILAVIHQQHLVTRIVKQNKDFVALCAEQNKAYIESADQRLAKANEMVLECTKSVTTLAQSADKLAEITLEMKEIIHNLRKYNDDVIAEMRKNNQEFKDAYVKLLHAYESLDREFKEELKMLANKPTITNNNIPEQTTL